MPYGDPFHNTDTLDEALLDVAALIELSPRDRRVAENRYRTLQSHLERPKSLLSPLLTDGASKIYAQGSIAISTTIVSGTDDDRFDVDAVVEIDVPRDWTNERALDDLATSLEGFPAVDRIIRCTRCVQLRFPFMHMDVTILDRRDRLQVERAGEIFHSPDTGAASRVASNPWGFTKWFRGRIGIGEGQDKFRELLKSHRIVASRDRLSRVAGIELELLAKAEQHPLPPMIPSAIDAQEAVALKLLKRYLNLHYEKLDISRPPSIYLTKRAGDLGYVPAGLTAQLYCLAQQTAEILETHIANGSRPKEENPSYPADRINDRWPRAGAAGVTDMAELANALKRLATRLDVMVRSPISEIAKGIDDLFGERIGKATREVLESRYDRRENAAPIYAQPRTGGIASPAIVKSSQAQREVPKHNFHCSVLDKGKNG